MELNDLECLWLEIKIRTSKRVLIGVFYRPPNSGNNYYSLIEDSIGLARESGIDDIIITGDFNLNTLVDNSGRKINSLSQQFAFEQCISDPTHYTENSSSVIDLLFVSNSNSLVHSGVGEPFLEQNIRFHCPIFGIFRYRKPVKKAIRRRIWKYDSGNYVQLRQNMSDTDCSLIRNTNIDLFTSNLTESIIDISNNCIPNKVISINPFEPPWMNADIKLKIRQRKRAYRKAKHNNFQIHWTRFRSLRNEVVALIRSAKSKYFDSLASKLKSS